MIRRSELFRLVLFCGVFFASGQILTADHRVLAEGQLPNDRRLKPLKDLNGYFPFKVPATVELWEARKESLQRRVLVANGLWPMPVRTPLNPVIHGKVERDGFTVEKVYFESHPGLFVTGLLFRPSGRTGKFPAVFSPHGHGGRLQDHGPEKIKKLIELGEEKYEASGRFPKLARCAQLARMGCVTLIIDMFGYADSTQISMQVAHRFSKQRPELSSKERWGLYSVQAELQLQSVMGLQTWNSIRALDFLASLPDVDPTRIGVTGGSGGGTQTILLGAIDSRPVVAFPQGMVSSSMQGGCTCENCSLLRIGTGNVELAALFAPRPQGMTAANDWTKAMMTEGYPTLQKLYGMLGAKDNVICEDHLNFPHNYNYVTRAMMCRLFNKHLKLGLEEPIVEEDWEPLTLEEQKVWDEHHPTPPGGPEFETSLTRYLAAMSDLQIGKLKPTTGSSLARFREVIGGAFQTIIGRDLPNHDELERGDSIVTREKGYQTERALLSLRSAGEKVPTIWVRRAGKEASTSVVIWLHSEGKAGLFDADGALRSEPKRLVAAGATVVGADLFLQGEFLKDGKEVTQTRVASAREYAGYSFGYNDTLFARRVHDILTLVADTRKRSNVEHVYLLASKGTGPWAAAARAIAGEAITGATIDTGGFRFEDLESFRDVNFLPGAVKYGDLPALLALSAPLPLVLAGEEGAVPDLVRATYAAAGKEAGVVSFKEEDAKATEAMVDWLLEMGRP